ncbi:MAG: thioredoxin family protein [Candidatus Pacebacteria bacterium]|nr:thioredoxin family protein [Candidatus Paceibacterota bacterium]
MTINNKEQIKTIIIGILAIGILAVSYYAFFSSSMSLSGQKAAEKAIAYVNAKVLTGSDKATLDGKVVSESGLYKFNVKVAADSFPSYVSKDGKLLFPQVMQIEDVESSSTAQNPSAQKTTIGNFLISSDQICYENEKPIFYFFGSQSCPHCQWEHPIIQKVAKLFEGVISFHENFDNTNDQDVFAKYSAQGYIPTEVIGCKYYRNGAGENDGEAIETQNLTALLCKITNNQPESVCSGVKSVVDSIAE